MIEERDLYCDQCMTETTHELYDYTEKCEIWDCKVCEDTSILPK